MGAVGKGTVGAVFAAVPLAVSLMDAGACFVVTEVIPSLSVASCPVQERASDAQTEN